MITYTITPVAGGCTGTAVNYVVTVRPTPDAAASNQTICSGQSTSVAITNPNSVAGTTFTWTVTGSTNVTGAANGSGATIGQVLTSTDGINSGTVTYQITPTANGCSGTPVSVTVTVNPSPAITNSPSSLTTTICSNTALNFTASTSITSTLNWTGVVTSGTATGVTASGTGAINDTPVNTGTTNAVITYTITPVAGGCTGTAVNYVVTVRPTPDAAASNQTICSGQSTSVAITNPNAVSGTTFTWTVTGSTNVTGAANGSGATIGQVLTSTDGINPGTVTYQITPTANGCSGTPVSVTVTVNPSPSITNSPSSLTTTICSNTALNFTASTSVASTLNWIGVVTSGTATGVTASGTGAINDTPVNTGTTNAVITYTITPVAGGCTGTAVNYVVTVRPTPDAAASNQTICSGQSTSVAITNPNSVAGTTFTWTVTGSTNVTGAANGSGATIGQVLTSTDGINSGTVTYQITPTANGCSGTPVSVTVTVNPSPAITNSPSSLTTTICSNTALNFTASTSITSTLNWTGVVISGTATGVTASGTGAITDTPVNTGTTNAVITYTITPVAGGCTGTAVNYVVTVRPTPDAAASNQTICSGQSTSVAITNPNAVSGTTFTWTVTGSTNVTGAANGSGATIGQVLTSTDGINSGTVTYQITPTANGCSGTPVSVTVTVNPVPLITNSPLTLIRDICSDTNINFTLTSNVTGASFTWSAVVTGAITGVPSSGSGSLINDTPVNSSNATAAVVYTITPSIGGCNGIPQNLIVTVRPTPTATASNQVICAGTNSSVAITNPNAVSGTTFAWSVLSSTNVTGAAPGTGGLIAQLLTTTDGVTDGSVVYRITPSANGCAGPTHDVTVLVKASPVITTAASALTVQICSGETLNFLPTSTIAGTTYTWTSTVAGPLSPITTSGSGVIGETPINTGNVDGTITYTITPAFNGCNGPSVNYVVTVKPLPSVTGADQTICSDNTVTINLSAGPKNVANTTFSWIATPSSNVIGASNGTGNLISQTLSTTNASVGTVVYAVTPAAGGCNGAIANITVTINPKVTVSAGADFVVCEPVTIPVTGTIGGSATLGTWTIVQGAGSISSSTTTGGTVQAVYTVSPSDITGNVILRLSTNDPDAAGPCVLLQDDVVIQINRRATVSVPANYTICETDVIQLSGTIGASATIGSWTPVTPGLLGTLSISSITGSNVTAGYAIRRPDDLNRTIAFRLTTNDPDGSGPCVAESADVQVTINESAKVDAGVNFAVCEDKIVELNGGFSGAATSVTWSGGSGAARFTNVADPLSDYNLTAADIAAGNITLTLTTNDPDGAGPCPIASDQVLVTINKLPVVQFFNLAPFYAENNPSAFLAGVPAGGTFIGPGIVANTNEFVPGNAGYGTVVIRYEYTQPSTGCKNFYEQSTIVNPVTDIDFTIPAPAVQNGLGQFIICQNLKQRYIRLLGIPEVTTTPNLPTEFTSPEPEFQSKLARDASGFFLDTQDLTPGTYNLDYTYTNATGGTNTIRRVIIVNAAPVAKITDFGNTCILSDIVFRQESTVPTGLDSLFFWSFGDDTYASTEDPLEDVIKRYDLTKTPPGPVEIELTVTTNEGCQNSTTTTIVLGSPPNVDFSWENICDQEITDFDNMTTPGVGAITEYAWEFGDGSAATGQGSPASVVSVPGTTGTFSDPSHDFNGFGVFNVKLTAFTSTGCSSSTEQRVYILNKPASSRQYFYDFETVQNEWVPIGLNTTPHDTSWILTDIVHPQLRNDPAGNNAWWTGKNLAGGLGTYFNNEQSAIIGPCLDLSDIERPMVSMNYWSHLQPGLDGAVLQYSVDGGKTWQNIGDASGEGINWYNSQNVVSRPGAQPIAWSDGDELDTAWVDARYALDQIPKAERDQVIFRIAFASNSDNPENVVFGGFAFDDIYIGEKRRTVIVEHFANEGAQSFSDAYLDNLYAGQFSFRDSSDFIKIQYQVNRPGADPINAENPADPSARALYYGVSRASGSVMDGILGRYEADGVVFNGDHALITRSRINKRALEDPLFTLSIDTTGSTADRLRTRLRFGLLQSQGSFTGSVIVNLALVEREVPTSSRVNKNVVRKLLLNPEGRTITKTWTAGAPPDEIIVPDWVVDLPITNRDSLRLVAFIQDRQTRRMHQVEVINAPKLNGVLPVGIEDDPIYAEVRELQVYPNPASKILKLSAPNVLLENYQWTIVDQRGVNITNGVLNQDLRTPQEIDVTGMANGVYFLRISRAGKAVTYRKVIVLNSN